MIKIIQFEYNKEELWTNSSITCGDLYLPMQCDIFDVWFEGDTKKKTDIKFSNHIPFTNIIYV